MKSCVSYELVVFYWAWSDSSIGRHCSRQYQYRKEFEGLDDAKTARDLINKYLGDRDNITDEHHDMLFAFTNDGAYFTLPAIINKVTRESIH